MQTRRCQQRINTVSEKIKISEEDYSKLIALINKDSEKYISLKASFEVDDNYSDTKDIVQIGDWVTLNLPNGETRNIRLVFKKQYPDEISISSQMGKNIYGQPVDGNIIINIQKTTFTELFKRPLSMDELLNVSTVDLDLSIESRYYLKENSILTIADLIKLNVNDLLSINSNYSCIQEIIDYIHELGLCFMDEAQMLKDYSDETYAQLNNRQKTIADIQPKAKKNNSRNRKK